MTNQEIFDKVSEFLIKQGKPCMTDVGCTYRGPDGLKCAVGCVLPDELYHPGMDTSDDGGIHTIWWKYPEVAGYFGQVKLPFLQELQKVHDKWSDHGSTETFARQMLDTAKTFGLSPSHLLTMCHLHM